MSVTQNNPASAELPDEIWAYRNKYCHENFGQLWSDTEHVNPCVKYIRADKCIHATSKNAEDERIKILVEALKWYADKKHWNVHYDGYDFLCERVPGGIAQQALKNYQENQK